MSKKTFSMPTTEPDAGEVNIVFAVKLGNHLVAYEGPIEEDLAKQMLALLGQRIFAAPTEAAEAL